MQIVECPKCKQKMLKIYTIGNDEKHFVDLSLQNANETAICRNCNSRIKYSVKKLEE